MTSITTIAQEFFDACETGKGWSVCSANCTPNATFSAQAEPLLDIKTLADYTEWMKGIATVLPGARYEVKSFATDDTRNNVAVYAVFHATPHRARRPSSADGPKHEYGLCVRDAVRRRQHRPHDKDLERRTGDEGSRLGLVFAESRYPLRRPRRQAKWRIRVPAAKSRLRYPATRVAAAEISERQPG
ncbi:MAG: hypothetical protein WDO73_25785 [Ignavibacteriota bacterium]